jgi:hypothetical protein
MMNLLTAHGLDVRLYNSAFHPYSFGVTAEELAQLRLLQRSLYRAIVAVVANWSKDSRISQVISLSGAERDLLGPVIDKPYRPGGFRPDFLHAADGRVLINEINARFALNAFISSMLTNRCMPLLNPTRMPLPDLEELETALQARLGDGPVGILKSSEHGCDIHLLRSRLGRRCEMLSPKELTASHLERWSAVILELHQQEILDEVPADLRVALAAHPGILNDLRTIFIAHDKRLLALLSTSDVLADYLDADDVARLRRHVVPTWVKGLAPAAVREALARPAGWLAKPCRSGKGEGVVISSRMSPDEWRQTLSTMPDDWVLQPYVDQQLFPITTVRQDTLVTSPMRAVGVLPALDDHAFGPGLYRASPDEIVNVGRGSVVLGPALMESCL